MNRKVILTSAILLAGLALAGCGNSQSNDTTTKAENSSLKAENSSLKAKKDSEKQDKYSEKDYALMAYLKLQGQTANELNRNKDNMHWTQDGNTYHIDFGAHTTSMTVNENNVEVTYDQPQGDSMGHDNGHKTYTKKQLAKEFGNQKSVIEEILGSVDQNQSNSDSQGNPSNTSSSNNDNLSANNGQQGKTGNSSSSSGPIKSSQDAANLVEHSMHSEPGTFQATPTGDGGYAIHGYGQDGQVGYVHSDGSVTWSDGETQSYGELSAPTTD